jgi:hypothetical protein
MALPDESHYLRPCRNDFHTDEAQMQNVVLITPFLSLINCPTVRNEGGKGYEHDTDDDERTDPGAVLSREGCAAGGGFAVTRQRLSW